MSSSLTAVMKDAGTGDAILSLLIVALRSHRASIRDRILGYEVTNRRPIQFVAAIGERCHELAAQNASDQYWHAQILSRELRCANSTQQHADCEDEGAPDDDLNDGVGKLSAHEAIPNEGDRQKLTENNCVCRVQCDCEIRD